MATLFQLYIIIIGHGVDAMDTKPFSQQQLCKVIPDEAGSAGDENAPHVFADQIPRIVLCKQNRPATPFESAISRFSYLQRVAALSKRLGECVAASLILGFSS